MIADELFRLELLGQLPRDEVENLAACCEMTDRRAGNIVYDGDGEDIPCVFLLASGRVEVLHADGKSGFVPVGQIGPGGLVGEFGAMVDTRGRCTVRALEPTRLIVIPRDVFRSLVERHASVAVHLLRDMIGVIRSLNDRVASLRDAHTEFDRIRTQLFRFVV
jgi:CRP-like cAMP-binding protein